MKSYIFLMLGLSLLSCSTKDQDTSSEVGDTAEESGDTAEESGDTAEESGDTAEETQTEPEPELYGPDNQWYHTTTDLVPDGSGCGRSNGDLACNFTLTDQNGDQVELYQFAGQVIVIDVFAEW